MRSILVMTALVLSASFALPAQSRPRARDLGVPFEGVPGPLNAITDVAGVEVGFSTLISGEAGPLRVGVGPVRTGVTAILPRGRASGDPVFAGYFSLNGNGEMTGMAWVEEAGLLEGPVFVTNTHSVGVVRDAAVAWAVREHRMPQPWALPVVAETWDGVLNDLNGFHVKPEHVVAAIEQARGGRVAEGNVGGGAGMICYGFKCGVGSSSRRVGAAAGGYTIGAIVQANHGARSQLRIAGVPVGAELSVAAQPGEAGPAVEQGSIIIVVATNAPLLPHQLKRVARRAALGLARTGATSGNGSGDLVLAFSTANPGVAAARETASMVMLSNARISAVFEATVQAVEEAIVNALVAADTMSGAEGRRIEALPHDRLRDLLRKYGRLAAR
jgi:L-aminopeptidase/D-esterase-like protein